MSPNQEQKERRDGTDSPADGGLQDLSRLEAALRDGSLREMSLHRSQQFARFVKQHPGSFAHSSPEMQVLSHALAFAATRELWGPETGYPEILRIQAEQVQSAFRAFDEKRSPEEIAAQTLRDDLFPPEGRWAVGAYRQHLLEGLKSRAFLRRLSAGAGDAIATIAADDLLEEPRFPVASRRSALHLISQALERAVSKVASDCAVPSAGKLSDDPAAREHCMRFLDLARRYATSVPQENDLEDPNFYGRHFRAIERHCLGSIADEHRLALRIFGDVTWVASALFFSGSSPSVVAAAVLIHANNSLQNEEGQWLLDAAEKISSDVKELVQSVKSFRPDPIRQPEKISELNCQRPLWCDPTRAGASLQDAQAIAAASALSPFYRAGKHELLETLPLLRAPGLPSYFMGAAKVRCRDEGMGSYRERNRRDEFRDARLAIAEIEGTLKVFRGIFWSSGPIGLDKGFFSSLHHASNLALRVIAAKGGFHLIREGLVHPFFDRVEAKQREWAKSFVLRVAPPPYSEQYTAGQELAGDRAGDSSGLSQVPESAASDFVLNLSSQLVAWITPEQRKSRWMSGVLTSLDFRTPVEKERYRRVLAEVAADGATGGRRGKNLGEFISENREEIIRRVEAKYLERILPDADRPAEMGRRALARLHDAGLEFGWDLSLLGSAGGKHDGNRVRSRVNAEGLGFWRILFRLESQATKSRLILSVPEDEALGKICALVFSESARALTQWDASGGRKKLAIMAGFSPARAVRDQEQAPLYLAENLEQFSLASEKIKAALLSITGTGTPRDQAQSYRHSLEVGLTLALGGAPADVVTAGILHDLYELVAKEDNNGNSLPEWLPEIRQDVRKSFGAHVDELIELLSEVRPPLEGTPIPFLERKMAIFRKIEDRHDRDPILARKAITVLLAAKVSTLTEGLFRVEEKGDSRPWSKGTFFDNLQVMLATRELAGRFCERNLIMELFDNLMASWQVTASGASIQHRLGVEYLHGSDRVSVDYNKAFELLSSAAQHGDYEALRRLAICYSLGIGVRQSSALAVELLNRSLKFRRYERYTGKKDEENEYQLLRSLFARGPADGETTADLSPVIAYLHGAAERGEPAAEFQLGLCRLYGWGEAKSWKCALGHFLRAAQFFWDGKHSKLSETLHCDQDDRLFSAICLELAKIYALGAEGIQPDRNRAAEYYNEAKRGERERAQEEEDKRSIAAFFDKMIGQ